MKIRRGESTVYPAVLLSSLFLISLTLQAGTLAAYDTEKVIVVFMGGVRNSEAFDDSTLQYLPYIAEHIVPAGVVCRNFYTKSFAGMGTGTFTATMGKRRSENNRGSNWHGLSPTMYEYYRKDRSIPGDEVWALLCSDFNAYGVGHSLHPAYGEPFGATTWASPQSSDREVLEKALEVMDSHEPSLITLHFRKVDREAQHAWDPDLPDSIAWNLYTEAIFEIDSYVGQIWDKITTDPAWAGKTTLFLTSAHGRHAPAYGGFEWHGDACSGCRRLPFLAAGPDFREGVVSELDGDLIDLSTTIGELLSFDPVFAEGRVLTELFTNPAPEGGKEPPAAPDAPLLDGTETLLSDPGRHSHSPSLAVTDNTIHAVWTERGEGMNTTSWDIVHRSNTVRGQPWNAATRVFAAEDPGREVCDIASIAADGSHAAVVVSMIEFDEYRHGDSAWLWDCRVIVTEDGVEWSPPSEQLFEYRNLAVIDNIPAVTMKNSAIVTGVLSTQWNRHFAVSPDLGVSWQTHLLDERPDDEFTSPDNPSLLLDNGLYYVETMRYRNHSRILFFTAKDDSLDLAAVLDDSPDESFFPQLAVSDSMIYCVWNDDRRGNWEVFFTRSSDRGATWSSNTRLSDSGVNTWRPALAAWNDTLLVVWEDYRDGESSIYKKVSFDGGVHWSADTPEVTTDGLSTAPRLAYTGGSCFLVWQDYRSGEWEIYAKQVDIDLPVGVEDDGTDPPGGPLPRQVSLSQNTPNPFNPSTTISFELGGTRDEHVTISIFDLRGRLVRLLADTGFEPGTHLLTWDGRDMHANPVASGIYLYTLEAAGKRITRKMLLAR